MIQTRYLLPAIFLLALGGGAIVWGDEAAKAAAPPDPCVTDLTLEKLDNPPERKTKFERSDEVWKERLTDVKVADQKFVAIVRIKVPELKVPGMSPGSPKQFGQMADFGDDEKHKDLISLQYLRGVPLLNPSGYSTSVGGGLRRAPADPSPETAGLMLKRMLEKIPADRQPAKEYQEFFSGAENFRLFLFPNRDFRQSDERRLEILAATGDEAEARARALLLILDQGFSRPLQMGLFKLRTEYCATLRETNDKLAAATKSVQDASAKLKDYEEFTADMLSGLRVQQLQLEVDLAGVKAKIATCERLLKQTPHDAEHRERLKQIEDSKVAAEIELSGFEARRAKSAEFVAKVRERNELTNRSERAQTESREMKRQQAKYTELIHKADEEIAAFGPVTLVDDRVTIHPLEWTQ
jgi:hypothetical protein